MTDLSSSRIYFETRELCHHDVYRHLSVLRKSLLELKQATKKTLSDNSLYWQQEIEKVKQEKEKEWLDRVNVIEAENRHLKKLMQNNISSSNDINLNYLQLPETEYQMEKLNRQLDEKIIQINRLQIAYAEQSKEMFELERSYVMLYCRYRRALKLQNSNPMKVSTDL